MSIEGFQPSEAAPHPATLVPGSRSCPSELRFHLTRLPAVPGIMRLTGIPFGERAGERHERDQSDNCHDGHHDNDLRIAETLTCDHERGGDVALPCSKRQRSPRMVAGTSQQPANDAAKRDE